MTTPLIGLAGAARSGKDTAAQVLVEAGWTRRAFADKVRDMLYATDPVLIDEACRGGLTSLQRQVDAYGWDDVKEMYPEVRRMFQGLGTDGGRTVLGEDVWVNALFRECEASGPTPTVITDVRFPNEARAIKDRGGLVILMHRPGGPRINGADHASENALAGWDFDAIVINGGDIESLRKSVISLALASTCD
ncbi:hypothetical protein ACIBCB_18190 [Streptomyces uncialis]|uniref:deoxynucleotide monophosphate kinase family protein n=1 Tax=Streptomyces uncialis TaxID=1048205 RepID=UPI003788851A